MTSNKYKRGCGKMVESGVVLGSEMDMSTGYNSIKNQQVIKVRPLFSK
jgi:hypothetical protein